jgi:glutaminyl-peptide cyclotransferase
MWQDLKTLTKIRPRHSNTPGSARAAKWIADSIKSSHLTPKVDTWTEKTSTGPMTFRNIEVTIEGRKPGFLVIGSHYDHKYLPGVPDFQGANDSGSSTVILLELIRVFSERSLPLKNTRSLRFVFFDGEECRKKYDKNDGLHGSKHYVAKLKNSKKLAQCKAMILLDMVGDRDLTITIPRGCDKALTQRFFGISKELGVRDQVGYYSSDILDDHFPFQQAGIPAINLIDFRYGPENQYWHTAKDNLKNVDSRSLTTSAKLAYGLISTVSKGD